MPSVCQLFADKCYWWWVDKIILWSFSWTRKEVALGCAEIRATVVSGDVSEKQKTTKGGLRGSLNKVVLAYSGGLDTSVIVPWLR
jgi:hypothetical protein